MSYSQVLEFIASGSEPLKATVAVALEWVWNVLKPDPVVPSMN
jgi:hypothetical protein